MRRYLEMVLLMLAIIAIVTIDFLEELITGISIEKACLIERDNAFGYLRDE